MMDSMLQNLFIHIMNMSITATYVILFVLAIRFLIKKAPKIFSYWLWAFVLFRLVCPFSFSSAFSLLKSISPSSGANEHIPMNIGYMAFPEVDMGINGVNRIINSSLPAATPYASVNPIQIMMAVLSFVWVVGVLMMIAYGIISYIDLKSKMNMAVSVSQDELAARSCSQFQSQERVFVDEKLKSPFVLGIFKPTIYLPSGLSDHETMHILIHEQTHIKRSDPLVKLFAFGVLCIHWFNPFVWLSFVMMSRDMEMSCDEKVIKDLGSEAKSEYSTSLLSMALSRSFISGSPLAFSESNVGMRIRNVLNYKKPLFWMVLAVAVLVVAVGVGLISNPTDENIEAALKSETYMNDRTEYVGNASKVTGIINKLTFPGDVSYDHIELQTENKPYAITIYLQTDEGMLDEAMVSDSVQYQENTLMLFSLIGNADEIIYNLSDGSKSNTMLFSRSWANTVIGGDIFKTSENHSSYVKFLSRLEGGAFNLMPSFEVGSPSSISVEKNLKAIMSSPQYSSNTKDYILAHQHEADSMP